MGRIVRAHGLRGEVKIQPETDDPNRFATLPTLYLGDDSPGALAYDVEQVRLQQTKRGPAVIVKLKGVDTREAAEAVRRLQVFARREDLPPLEADEYYVADVIGFAVFTEDGTPVGRLKDVLETGGHDVWLIAREGRPDLMIPAVPAFIGDLDLDAARATIRPIEGLLD